MKKKITHIKDLMAILGAAGGEQVLLVGDKMCSKSTKMALAGRGLAKFCDRTMSPSGHYTLPMRATKAGVDMYLRGDHIYIGVFDIHE